MRALVLVLLFIAVPLAGGSLKPELEADYWKDSGVDLAFAVKIINDADCASSPLYFQSCVAAVRKGAEIQKLAAPDLTNAKPENKIGFEKLIAQIITSDTGESLPYLIGRILNAQIKIFDPYAQLAPASYLEALLSGDTRTYYGTGIETDATGEGLFVFGIYPNSPAERLRLRVHDRIVSLNGEKFDTLLGAYNGAFKLAGKPGDKLNLEILRDGRLFDLSLPIALVEMPQDFVREIGFEDKRFLHARVRNFHRGTCDALKANLDAVGEIDGLILDLRHNRGGLVDEAECVVRLFEDATKVVTREPITLEFPRALFNKAILPDHAKSRRGEAAYQDLKLIVLIDAKSASSSEITAGALQDLARAWILGERSYGKGTTQIFSEVKGKPNLKISRTVSKYIRPGGLSVHGQGVTPDFEVPLRLGATRRDRRSFREENLVSAIRIPPGPKWQESRGAEISEIETCVRKKSLGTRAENAIGASFGYPDHQAAAALAILNCP